MTAQLRPDELIRILRAEFAGSPGSPGAGGACVTFVCGATGWRGTGGTIPRTLVHEVAFQLESAGNARGANAIDLQVGNAAAEVAAADFSVILGGENNKIDSGADYSAILGPWNYVEASASGTPYLCFIVGNSNYITGDQTYQATAIGEAHNINDAQEVFFAGYGNRTRNTTAIADEAAFGAFSIGEQNDFIIQAVNHQPNYCCSFGLLNDLTGNTFNSYQMGESHVADGGDASATNDVWNSLQVGYSTKVKNAQNTFIFGHYGESLNPTPGTTYYNGRIVLANGAYVSGPSSPHSWGYNQDSIFFQGYLISSWPAAYATAWQFPIISDSIWYFEIFIAGTETGCANSFAWKIEGVVENDGGTTSILAQTVTNFYRDVATREWQVAADDANDRLLIQYQDATLGPDATATNIMMRMHTVEVGKRI